MKEIKQESNTVDYNGMIDSPLYQKKIKGLPI